MYIVINGGGKIGSYLARTLKENGHYVAVIEIDENTALRLAKDLPEGVLVLHGDGCDSMVLQDAETQNADIFVATTGRDDDNLVSCELAKTIFATPRCIARVNNPRNERIFRRMGIESVSSTMVITRLIEEEALAGTMKAMKSLRQNDVCIIELRVPGGGGTLAERGVKIEDLQLPAGSIVAAVHKEGALEIATPDMLLFPGDNVVVLAENRVADDVREFLREL